MTRAWAGAREARDRHPPIVSLAREAEHRTKNILSTVPATVRLSRADTSDDLKQLIEGRVNALAQVHGLFVESRWDGSRASQSGHAGAFALLRRGRRTVRIDGPPLMLELNVAQTVAISLQNSRPTLQNTVRCRRRVVVLKSPGPGRQTDGSGPGSSQAGRRSRRRHTAASAGALWKT
jgi:HWE histidine kinase